MEDIRKNIAKNILYHRKKCGFSQKELADRLGVKNVAVSNWEREMNSPDIESVFKMCRIFDLTVDDFFGVHSAEATNKELSHKQTALTEHETQLLTSYRDLNPDGQEKLLDYADDLVLSGKYKKYHPSELVAKNA